MAGSKVVSVGTTPTLLGSTLQSMVIQNLSAVAVFVGGSGVTADTTATGGLQLPASNTTPVQIPPISTAAVADPGLYARVASGTANVAVLGL